MSAISRSNSEDGAATLTVIALASAGGYADAASFLLSGSFTGHVTGNIVFAALSLASGKNHMLGTHLLAIALFLSATACGLLLSRAFANKAAGLISALCIEMALVALAATDALAQESHSNLFLIACLCLALGLQNGAFDESLGVSVHATYLTGDTTKLLASMLQKESSGRVKRSERHTAIRILCLTSISFAASAVLAGFAVHYFAVRAFWVLELPILLTTFASTRWASGWKQVPGSLRVRIGLWTGIRRNHR